MDGDSAWMNQVIERSIGGNSAGVQWNNVKVAGGRQRRLNRRTQRNAEKSLQILPRITPIARKGEKLNRRAPRQQRKPADPGVWILRRF